MPTIAYILWVCPNCKTAMHDDIDDELGPFLSCICDKCGKSFSQSDVVIEEQEVRSQP